MTHKHKGGLCRPHWLILVPIAIGLPTSGCTPNEFFAGPFLGAIGIDPGTAQSLSPKFILVLQNRLTSLDPVDAELVPPTIALPPMCANASVTYRSLERSPNTDTGGTGLQQTDLTITWLGIPAGAIETQTLECDEVFEVSIDSFEVVEDPTEICGSPDAVVVEVTTGSGELQQEGFQGQDGVAGVGSPETPQFQCGDLIHAQLIRRVVETGTVGGGGGGGGGGGDAGPGGPGGGPEFKKPDSGETLQIVPSGFSIEYAIVIEVIRR